MEARLMLLLFSMGVHFSCGYTDPQDAAVVRSLKDSWQNLPPGWTRSDDPCGDRWEGMTCNNSRIIALKLSNMGIKGTVNGDIGGLTELRSLDLSFNTGLKGSVSPAMGNLKNLNILILIGCRFSGEIPKELGSLSQLTFLALNSNNFTGPIPPSLGNLSNLYWLDLADNQLSGSIPVSPGLDQLIHAKHFHLNKNQLSGVIPPKLFSFRMVLIHLLLDGNHLTGVIPSTLGLVQTLEVVRLDRNSLTGPVPHNLKNLTNLLELRLSNNQLTGAIPDLTNMEALNYVDVSSNAFQSSEAPKWFSSAQDLTVLMMESASLQGEVPQALFSLPRLQQINLGHNNFSGTLDMGNTVSHQLIMVDLQFNNITSITLGSGYTKTLELHGNPVCSQLSYLRYCHLKQPLTHTYSTNLARCGDIICHLDQKLGPQSCECSYPLEGTMYFRAPLFRDLSNSTTFHSLEMQLCTKLGLTPGSVLLQKPFFNMDDYLQIQVEFYPSSGKHFNRTEIQTIGFDLTNQTFKPPPEFGPYYFIASPYAFPGSRGKLMNSGIIIAIVVGCGFLVLAIMGMGIYALKQKKRAERAIESSQPFASWGTSGKDSVDAPQLKGAKGFRYDELKKCTNSFSKGNEIGSGGYGKVYRGTLPGAQLVAVKRAQQGSMQGGHEFKTEIELLSRVHHRNLVALIGFCFDKGEQMLVYEYMPNGTLRDSLTGKSGISLDWKRRLRIALGSARGLAYLHELADPPIIHRDVKSTNILLDENLTAKVADFGLSKLVSDSTKGHVSTQVKGTLGYLDPEYYTTQKLTEKSDVYSFGVVMLELVTSKQPIEKGKYIVREVRGALKKYEEYYGLHDILDPNIRNAAAFTGFERFLELALQCVQESAIDRPTMSDVVKEMETILHKDEVKSGSTSASSSTTDFGCLRVRSGLCPPYNEPLQIRDDCCTITDAIFDGSGRYMLPARVEPK